MVVWQISNHLSQMCSNKAGVALAIERNDEVDNNELSCSTADVEQEQFC